MVIRYIKDNFKFLIGNKSYLICIILCIINGILGVLIIEKPYTIQPLTVYLILSAMIIIPIVLNTIKEGKKEKREKQSKGYYYILLLICTSIIVRWLMLLQILILLIMKAQLRE